MIIPIKRDNGLEEWVIVELQGDLRFDHGNTTDKCIGDLHFTKRGIPILIIGIYVLQGKQVDLPKPFAVLIKQTKETPDIIDGTNGGIEYIVKSFVKKKFVFRMRPKPIVTNVPMCN